MIDKPDYADLPELPEEFDDKLLGLYPGKIFDEHQMREYAALAVKQALANRWYPIDTAPKDGTRILVFEGFGGHFREAYYLTEEDAKRSDDSTAEGWKSNETGWDLHYVSYWMPLPESPKEKE